MVERVKPVVRALAMAVDQHNPVFVPSKFLQLPMEALMYSPAIQTRLGSDGSTAAPK